MKKRLISLLLALVMILGMIPATALTASAAGTEIIGIEVIGEGYTYDTSLSACTLVYPDVSLISASGKIAPDECLIAGLCTDEACNQRLKTEPQLGETYYFKIYIAPHDAPYNITNSKSNIKISGFYNGKVLSTNTTDYGYFRIICSVTFGELTGGVKAIASGVEYDSELGGYAPNFTTLKAVSTEGKELENTVVDGVSYYGAKSGCLYKTNSGTSFSDMLTTEPQIGETYYSYFLLNSIDGNLHIEEDLVDIHIPGYEVEYIDCYERDMGFTSLIVYSVTKQTEITGIEVIGEGYTYSTFLSAYSLIFPDVSLISASGKIAPDECLIASLYTNEACTQRLRTEPQLDETYYFEIRITPHNALYNITNSKSNIKISGFYNGKVLSTDTTESGYFLITCSVTFGELTGGVKAIASGVKYDSELGGYAPQFTTLKAVSTEGKELEPVKIPDGNYYISYYGATAGSLYKTNRGTTFSDKLTTEPQIGETYYSYFLLNSIDGNLHIEEDLVDIQIPGYEVEYLASYERDMGFTSLVVYSVAKKSPDVYVGGVGMYDGDYLAVGATTTRTTKPSGGYAYYKDGVLTLNNYSYEGEGYQYTSIGYYAVIYSKNNLTLELIGNNTLTQTDSGSDMIYVDGVKLTVGGNGKLTGTSRGYALYAYGDLTINGGTIEVSTYFTSILSNGNVIINGGDITAESEDRAAIYSKYDVTVNGGNVTATGGNQAIDYSTGFTVPDSMKIQASTTVDGALGEYVAANHDSYKKIVIAPAPAVTVPAKPYKIINVVSGVHVYWKTVPGAAKYGLWRSETGKNGTYKWIANPTVPHFTDTKVESGKTYYYKVTSMDAAGNHSEKSEAIGVIYVGTPDITSRFNKAAGITVGWNKIQGATGYAIYRKSYSGSDAWVRVGTVSGNSTFTWQDTEVKNNNGTVYRYTVRALAGSDMKTLSGCRNTGRTMARLTSRVLNSAVKASATSIKCSWTTSSVVTGYEVRFMVGSTVYKTFTVGNYKTGVKTFTGLKAGQTYKIQVRSYLKVDGMGFYSAWSEAKNVTLP